MTQIQIIEDQLKQEAAEKFGFVTYSQGVNAMCSHIMPEYRNKGFDMITYYNEHRDQRIASKYNVWVYMNGFQIDTLTNMWFHKKYKGVYYANEELFSIWNTSTE